MDYHSFLEDYISMIMAPLYSVKIESSKIVSIKEKYDYSIIKDFFQLNLAQHLNILIVGLGGGVLANYCKTWLKDVRGFLKQLKFDSK